MIKNFYILTTNGQPLYLQGEIDSDKTVLLSGFLGAINMLAGTLDKSHLNKIELASHSYFYSIHDSVISVIEADPKDEVESRTYQIIAQKLGKSFIETYTNEKILDWAGSCDEFCTFTKLYERIVSEVQQMLNQSHRDFITKYFVETGNDKNILGRCVFDLEKDEIIASDIPNDISVKDFENFGSMLFNFVGKLGKELKSGDINEILIRAKKYWIGGFKKGNLAVFMLFSQDYFGAVLPEFVTSCLNDKTEHK
jgi:hypothetical protein